MVRALGFCLLAFCACSPQSIRQPVDISTTPGPTDLRAGVDSRPYSPDLPQDLFVFLDGSAPDARPSIAVLVVSAIVADGSHAPGDRGPASHYPLYSGLQLEILNNGKVHASGITLGPMIIERPVAGSPQLVLPTKAAPFFDGVVLANSAVKQNFDGSGLPPDTKVPFTCWEKVIVRSELRIPNRPSVSVVSSEIEYACLL